MSELEIVENKFEGLQVRTHIDEHGRAWFATQDILDILGLKYKTSAMKRLAKSEVGSIQSVTPGGIQNISAVSEPGMYKLIIRSDKPNAQRFIDWITNDVLPSIRKTGSYAISQNELSPLDILENHVRQQRVLERANAELSAQIKVIEVVARQDHDTLTHDQIKELDTIISQTYDITGDYRDIGRARKLVKARFGLNGAMTWKEMPRHGFDDAKALVESYKKSLKRQIEMQ